MSLAFFGAVMLWCAGPAETSDHSWGQWRGPLANGVAPHADPPVHWSETRNVRWKVPVAGFGLATPIVWGNRVYLQTAESFGDAVSDAAHKSGRRGRMPMVQPTHQHKFKVIALDRATGKTVWERIVKKGVPHDSHHGDASYASASPLTNGRFIFAHYGSNGVYCLDMTGRVQWDVDLGDMHTRKGFGEGSSPVLHEDTLVINWDHEGDSFIVALNARDGTTRWRKARDEVTSWTTPLIVEHNGRAQVVVSATNRVRGYDLENGAVLWECGGQSVNAIPSPMLFKGHILAMSGYKKTMLCAINLSQATGDVTESAAVSWRYEKDTSYVPSGLLFGDTMYFMKGNRGILTALDARTGKPHYAATRLEGIDGVYASPVGARDRVYIVGRNGVTVVLRHGPKFEVLATNELDADFGASPGLAGDALFLRSREHVYCLAGGTR